MEGTSDRWDSGSQGPDQTTRGARITGSTDWVELGPGRCLGNSDMGRQAWVRPVLPGSPGQATPAAPKALELELVAEARRGPKHARTRPSDRGGAAECGFGIRPAWI